MGNQSVLKGSIGAMKDKLSVILCASAHIPSGTNEAEFETLYNREIKPLFSSLEKFPRISMAFHYSGVVLYWIERHYPEFFMLLEDLFSRKQAEFLGGGFYNPVLPLLSQTDKIGQMEMLTTYLRKHFGKRPQGCWLPSTAWEQSLVSPLSSCGFSYTFLHDRHFSLAGIKPDAGGIFSPCIAEDQGKIIKVFPVATVLSNELKEGKPLKILEELAGTCVANQIVSFSIGGGLQAQALSYENLFAELSKAEPWVEFNTPTVILKKMRRPKKQYLPGIYNSEYKAGEETHPRQFLANYPEADSIYTKTLYVHTLINNHLRVDKARKRTALEELWKAQDSGIFSMSSVLSHSSVRKAAYRALLEAEKITREKVKFTSSLSVFDYDLDGEDEYILQDEKLNCYLRTKGAGIFELDYLPNAWNYLDTMAPLNSNKKRCAFVDWLAPSTIIPRELGPEGIPGGRFCGEEEYESIETDRSRLKASFRLPPKPGALFEGIEIEKTWHLKKNSLTLDYVLRNKGSNRENFTFCSSLDLSFFGEGKEFLRVLSVKDGKKECLGFEKHLTTGNIKALEFLDIKNETIISLEISRASVIKIFNVYSGLPGQEEYQSTCIIPLLYVSIDAGKTYKISFSLKISS